MNAKELRLGNTIRIGQADCWQKEKKGTITQVTIGALQMLQGCSLYKPEALFEPVDISTEELVRLGFGFDGEFYFKQPLFENMQCRVHLFASAWVCGQGFGDYYQEVGHPLKFVHELQNFYYSLTGEELEYNPDAKPQEPIKEPLKQAALW